MLKYLSTLLGFPQKQENSKLIVSDFSNVILRVETTNYCNFKCSFCTHSLLSRPKGFMNDKLFNKIINEGSELGFKNLDLRNFGEPLVDKDLYIKTRLAKKLNYENIYIHTNGFLLDKDCFNKLTDAGMNMIILSLSPKREFEETRGKYFDKIIQNLTQINSCDNHSVIMIDYINIGQSTLEEVSQFKSLINNLGYSIREEIQLHNWASGDNLKGSIKPCHRLWTSFTVLIDGTVSLCCLDWNGQVKLGDVNKKHIADIINSKLYQKYRKSHLDGNLFSICKKCDMVHVKDC